MTLLAESEIDARLASLDGWHRAGGGIAKEFEFGRFADAMRFANQVAADAERADHHPDILVRFRRVTIVYITHSAGGLTDLDFEGARATDRAAGAAA